LLTGIGKHLGAVRHDTTRSKTRGHFHMLVAQSIRQETSDNVAPDWDRHVHIAAARNVAASIALRPRRYAFSVDAMPAHRF